MKRKKSRHHMWNWGRQWPPWLAAMHDRHFELPRRGLAPRPSFFFVAGQRQFSSVKVKR